MGQHPAFHQFLIVLVRREALMQDALTEISRQAQHLKRPLRVIFMSGGVQEEGVDQGGVTKVSPQFKYCWHKSCRRSRVLSKIVGRPRGESRETKRSHVEMSVNELGFPHGSACNATFPKCCRLTDLFFQTLSTLTIHLHHCLLLQSSACHNRLDEILGLRHRAYQQFCAGIFPAVDETAV